MTPREHLLLFIALEGAPDGLDPVRLQKGMFLFAQESGVEETEKYEFVPYNYGPMSSQIYSDLDDLVAEGLVEAVPVQGQSWARYVPTSAGIETGRRVMLDKVTKETASQLHAIKKDVASKSFRQVLEDVYERYPKFATASVFERSN